MAEYQSTKKDPPPPKEREMSFWEHLEELRWNLVRSIAAVLVLAIVAFIFKDFIFDKIILAPIRQDFLTTRLLCSFADFVGGKHLCELRRGAARKTPGLKLQILGRSRPGGDLPDPSLSMRTCQELPDRCYNNYRDDC